MKKLSSNNIIILKMNKATWKIKQITGVETKVTGAPYQGPRAVWRLQKHCSCFSYFKLHYRIHCHWAKLQPWLMLYRPLMVRGIYGNDKRRQKPVWVISHHAPPQCHPLRFLWEVLDRSNWLTLTNDSHVNVLTEVARIWPLRMFECHSSGVRASVRLCERLFQLTH